jgi:hypothetical protein
MYLWQSGKGGPTHLVSTDKVPVDVENALQGILARIKNQPVARLPNTDDFCHNTRSKKDLASGRFIFRGEIAQRSDMPNRNNQYMLRSYGRDIPECNNMIITINNTGGNLSSNDPAKETIRLLMYHMD